MATTEAIHATMAVLTSAGLVNAPKTPEQGEALVKLWELVLSEITDLQLEAATVAYLRDPEVCQFWPQPGKILERVPGRQRIDVDTADVAWGVVQERVRRYGSYTPPGAVNAVTGQVTWAWEGDDAEAIHAGVEALGGWLELCMLTYDDIPAARAAFRNAYRSMRRRAEIAAEEGTVAGLLGRDLRLLIDKA